MNSVDVNYTHFIKAYESKNFDKAGNLAFEILSMLPEHTNSIPESWQYNLSLLFQFLHETSFIFKAEDDFYEMLSTISFKIKSNPHRDWKTILS
ncbi:MAG: hypothetical protein JWQ38_1950 [Flavipsychrobacter sp.]|nr:hypothetical protein [Flavipsychrobacter sp.]